MTSSRRGEVPGLLRLAGFELPPVLADALGQCRRHFMAAAVFSLLINILYLAPTLYMLQVYDRVVSSASEVTLVMLTILLLMTLAALASLDAVRARFLRRYLT